MKRYATTGILELGAPVAIGLLWAVFAVWGVEWR